MYSLPQVYGSKPFDASKYLPSCMYASKPYYATDSTNAAQLPTMASILPLPLLPTDLDMSDSNIKHTLDDILSRQMLLLCRLNQLEQQLLSEQNQALTNGLVNGNESSPKKADLSLPAGKLEDIVIHFSLNSIPYSLFALASALNKQTPVMVNLHVHSSAQGLSGINQLVGALKSKLDTTIGLRVTSNEQYLTRSQFPLIITFIVTAAKGSEPYAAFAAGQKVIQGELAIAKQLIGLVAPSESSAEAAIWSILANPQTISSDKAILEQLGPLVFGLTESQFLLQQSTTPSLLDVVLWSLTVPEFGRGSLKVASTLTGTQLLNAKWQASVRRFVSSN